MRAKCMMGSALTVALLLTASAVAADDLESGSQKPSMKIGAFNPLHCSGKGVGTKGCLV